jgi:hypothetical protein
MKNSLLLLILFLILTGTPARAQNIWPVSFGYWCGYSDRYMPDLVGADQSMAHADQLSDLDGEGLRGLMQSRSRAMSQRELSSYHSPNMLEAIYPTDDKPRSPASEPPAGGRSSSLPEVAPLPAPSTSPFPASQPAGAVIGAPAQETGLRSVVKPAARRLLPGTTPRSPSPTEPASAFEQPIPGP